jgi:hypothetical protein
LADCIIVTNVLPPEQTPLFAYSRQEISFGCFFVSSNARTKSVRAEPSPPELSEALQRHQVSSNEVFGTDNFTDERLSNHHVDAVDPRHIHSNDMLRFITDVLTWNCLDNI